MVSFQHQGDQTASDYGLICVLDLEKWLSSGHSLRTAARLWLKSHVKPYEQSLRRHGRGENLSSRKPSTTPTAEMVTNQTINQSNQTFIRNNNNNQKNTTPTSKIGYQIAERKAGKSFSLRPSTISRFSNLCRSLEISESKAADDLLTLVCDALEENPADHIIGEYLLDQTITYLQAKTPPETGEPEDGDRWINDRNAALVELEKTNYYLDNLRDQWPTLEKNKKTKAIQHCSKHGLLERLKSTVKITAELETEAQLQEDPP